MSAPAGDPLNAYPLASAVVRGASRAVPFVVQLFRPGEDSPYAETELMGWELEPSAEGDPEDATKFRKRLSRLILKVEVPSDGPHHRNDAADIRVPEPVTNSGTGPLPVKRAGRAEPAPPNAGDGEP